MDASMTHASSLSGTARVFSGQAQLRRRALGLAALCILAAGVSGCGKLKARDLLNKGVQAFKNGQYDSAIEDFKMATESDPNLLMARVYLATAYASEYIPGAPSDANTQIGDQAVKEFKEVLERDPNNITAIDGLGSMLYNMSGTPFSPQKFEDSKSYHKKHIELKPNDPEPYYWIGVINWVLSNRTNLELRAAYNKDHINKQIKESDPLPPAVRADYVAKSQALVEEGIDSVKKAIEIRSDYDDAMAYLNLLYRRKADMVEAADERAALQKQADDLLDKIKEIKQHRADQPQQPPAS
jgi:tetratricopeptide (TPR) repeat protein